jgi:hypothetical protein
MMCKALYLVHGSLMQPESVFYFKRMNSCTVCKYHRGLVAQCWTDGALLHYHNAYNNNNNNNP